MNLSRQWIAKAGQALKRPLLFALLCGMIFSGWPPSIVRASSTGALAPGANAARASSAGDNDGFETSASNVGGTVDTAYATSASTGTGNATDGCATFNQSEDDAHDFYNFGIAPPANSTIDGIQVDLNGKWSTNSGTNQLCVEISWDGGTSWTATGYASGDLQTAAASKTLGGAADTWSRTWTVSELSDGNFRLRVMIDPSASNTTTASLDSLTVTVTYTPPSTTLGDGTNPGNSTVAPGSSITDMDAFTFVASAGTDTITALTVTLAAGTYLGLSEARITSNDGATTYFSAVSNPSGNTVNFSGGTGLPVTSLATTFRVRITPKSHAAMPLPVGEAYAVTGTVTSWTSTNTQAGSDAASATITVDNLSPNAATATSGSAGDTQITLNWTTSASSDFSKSVVLRWAASTPGTEVPVEGTTYAAGDTVSATSTVACVRTADAASTAVSGIDGLGTGGCGAAALTNGQAYSYKVFQQDADGNYDLGTVVSGYPFTPVTAVISVTITTDGTVSYGALPVGTNKSTVDLSDTQTAKNDGNVTENLNIRGQNSTCPWTLAATGGADQYAHEFSTNGGGLWTALTTSYQTLATGVAVNGTQAVDLRVTVPTSTNCFGSQAVDIVVQAVQP